MRAATPALLETQRALRASLIDHDDSAAVLHIVAGAWRRTERLDVYRNTFVSVLTNALRLSYPAVHRLVGPEFFDGAARIFIARNPPRSASLDDYGAEFSAFLTTFAPAASLVYLSDVALLEWAVCRALHAADVRPLDARRLTALGEAERAQVRFTPHPSVALVRSRHPADQLWRAVLDHDDAALAAVDPASGPVWLMVQRSDSGIDITRLSESAYRFTEELFAGQPLHILLEESWDFDPVALLADHLAAGRFAEFRLDDGTDSTSTGSPT